MIDFTKQFTVPGVTEPYRSVVRGDLLCVAGEAQGLVLISLADSDNPVIVSVLTVPGAGAFYLSVSGDLLAVNCGTSFILVDISDPLLPVILSTTSGVSLGEIRIVGNLLFTRGNISTTRKYDITNPSIPVLLQNITTPNSSSIVVHENYLYITAQSGIPYLGIYDIGSLITPTTLVGQINVYYGTFMTTLPLDSSHVLVGATSGVYVLNVSDPTTPFVELTVPGSLTYSFDLAKWGNNVLVNRWLYPPQVLEFDFSDVLSPVLLQTATPSAERVNDVQYYYTQAILSINFDHILTVFGEILAPNPPSGLFATFVGVNRVDLQWTDNSLDELSFELQRKTEGGDWSLIATLGPDEVVYSDLNLHSGTNYTYRVRATNIKGPSAYSNELAVTTLPLPGGPVRYFGFYNLHYFLWLFSRSLSEPSAYLDQTHLNRFLATCDAATLRKKYGPWMQVFRPTSFTAEQYRSFLQSLVELWKYAPARALLEHVLTDVLGSGYRITEYFKGRRFILGSAFKLRVFHPNPLRVRWTTGQFNIFNQWFRLLAGNLDVPDDTITYVYCDGEENADRYAVVKTTSVLDDIPVGSLILGKVTASSGDVTAISGCNYLGIDDYLNTVESYFNAYEVVINQAGRSIWDDALDPPDELVVLLKQLLPKIVSAHKLVYVRFEDDTLSWQVQA